MHWIHNGPCHSFGVYAKWKVNSLSKKFKVSLFSWIKLQTSPINLNVIYKILLEIALGMYYLHGRTPQIIHRDLKSPNVLVFIHS